MTAAGNRSRHPSAGLILRRMDGELDPALDRKVARHVERCAVCRGRERRMRGDADDVARAVGEALRLTPVPELRRAGARRAVRVAVRSRQVRRWRLRGLATAASAAGVLVLSWTVGPLRAWVWERGAEEAGDHAVPAVLPGARVGTAGSIVAFTAEGETFALEIEHVQAGGDLLLQTLDIDRASAQIMNSSSESMLVLPRGLRIENAASSLASYRVTLPAGVRRVMLRVGDSAPRVITVGAEGWREEIAIR